MFWRVLLTSVLAAALAPAFAQRGGGGPRGQAENGDEGFGTGPAARQYTESRLDRIGDMLRLNREQKNGAKEIFDAAQKEAAPVREEIQKGRAAVAVAMLAQKSQPEIDQLLANYGTLAAQMTAIELRALTKLVGTLNADQQKRVGPVFSFMSGMFSGRNWNSQVN